jgi:hypothetical protein
VDALRINTMLLRIELSNKKFDKVILKDDVYPRLKANRFRARVAAIAKQKGDLFYKDCLDTPWSTMTKIFKGMLTQMQ